ncbi:T9SS type A sorting domain-containing protein [bacterium]|nr:T9SS type A sorting domain-containing protein [bacterium]
MVKKNSVLLISAILMLCLTGVVLGQYKMERNTFAPGVPGKSDAGSTYIMSEGAIAQTAADITEDGTYVDQQGYIHRPFNLQIDYSMADLGYTPTFDAELTPQQGWYEPTGKLEIHAEAQVVVVDTLFYFDHWSSTTGASFNDAAANDTWFPFYQSHSVSAVYKTQYKVIFAANTKNDEDYVDWDPVTYTQMKTLDASDYVKVSYSNQGSSAETTPIYDGTSVTTWADYDQDWTFDDYNESYVPASDVIRWLTIDTDHTGPISAAQAGATVTCDYYQQFKCVVDIVYNPLTGTPGTVDGVTWNECNVAGTPTTGYTDDNDWVTTPSWADAACHLAFPEITTGGWFTVNLREWEPLDKPLTKTIVYGERIVAMMAANMLMWRGYSLMGVPLYPVEDTVAYREHVEREGGSVPAGWPPAMGRSDGRGDQEVVVYDDLDSNCVLCDAISIEDSVFGVYGNWWSVSKYYPETGAYRRYRGPGVPIEGSVEPFWPGRGYWFIQDHCDSLPIDVFGTLVDTTEPYDIPLGVFNGSSYSMYNMIANPFFDPDLSDTIDVQWAEAQVYLASDTTVKKVVDEAATSGWIDATAQVYRDGGYVPMNASIGDEDAIFEAEGVWVKTGDAPAIIDDTVYIRMRPHSLIARRRERPAPIYEIVSQWKVRLGAECEIYGQRDFANFIGYREYSEMAANPVYSTYEMPDYTYPAPHLRVFMLDDESQEVSSMFKGERTSVMSWPAVIDGRAVKGQKVNVSWDVDDIPEGMRLHLKDPAHDEYIDMLEQKDYSFIGDGNIYNIEIIANAPLAWVAKEVGEVAAVPKQFYIESPMPNPFNASTRIEFGLAEGDGGVVRVEVFDLLGRKINTIHDGILDPGIHRYTWTGIDDLGRDVASGTYFIRFNGAGREITKQVSLIK